MWCNLRTKLLKLSTTPLREEKKEGEPEIDRVEKQLMDLETVFNYQNEQKFPALHFYVLLTWSLKGNLFYLLTERETLLNFTSLFNFIS